MHSATFAKNFFLAEINTSKTVYTSSVNSGYSDCTLRITYSATVNSDASVIYGDDGNTNAVSLRWQRSRDDGRLVIKGAYILTEVRTDNRYTLLKDDIHVTISTAEADVCNCYTDTLGVTQNDARYTHIQKHLEHKLLTASASVDERSVTMLPDSESPNALAPLTVINTRGFDLPQTGGRGNWIYPAIGITLMAVAGAMLVMMRKKKK